LLATHAFPAANHASPEEIGSLLLRQTGLKDRVVRQKLIELGNKLLELAEDEEGAVFGPVGTSDVIARLSDENLPCGDKRLTRFRVLEYIEGRVRDPVQEAEICG
jgi:hypothetical protein